MIQELARKFGLHDRFGRDVLWNILGYLVTGVCGISVHVLIFAIHGSSVLGAFNQVFTFYIILVHVATGGIHFSTLTHVSQSDGDPGTILTILTSALMLVVAFSLVTCAGLLYFRDPIAELLSSPAVGRGILWVVPGLFFFSINKVLLMTLIGMRRMRAFAFFQALRFPLVIVGIATLTCLNASPYMLPAALSCAELLLFLTLLVFVSSSLVRVPNVRRCLSIDWMRKHVSFGIRAMPSGFLIDINTRTDILLLGYYLTDRAVGMYSIAAVVGEGYAQLTTIIRQNIDPVAGKALADGAKGKIEEVSRMIRHRFVPLMAVLGALMVALFPIGLKVVGIVDTGNTIWVAFSLLIIGYVVSSGFRPFSTTLLVGGRPGTFTVLLLLLALLNIVLNCLLITRLGINGAAASTALVYSIEAGAVIYLCWRLLGIKII